MEKILQYLDGAMILFISTMGVLTSIKALFF